MIRPGTKVTVKEDHNVKVAGHPGPHKGRTGTLRGYTDLMADPLIAVVDLDEPIMVANGVPNPISQQSNLYIHGVAELPPLKVDWIEVPVSCLS